MNFENTVRLRRLLAGLCAWSVAWALCTGATAQAQPVVIGGGAVAGSFAKGPAYTGGVVLAGEPSPAAVLLISDDSRPSLVLTSLTGAGPALVGSQAIYGVAVQGKGSSRSMPDGPPLSVTSTASMATNQQTMPLTNPPAAWAGNFETFGALSVRSLGVGADTRSPGSGGSVSLNVQGGSLAVGVPDSGTGIVYPYLSPFESRFWYPWASAIYAQSAGGAANRPSWSDCEHNQNPSDGGCRFDADRLFDAGNGGAVTVKVGGTASLVLDTSGPDPGYTTLNTNPGVQPTIIKVRTPVQLVGVTALSEGGLNGFRGIFSIFSNHWAYSNSGFGAPVAVDFAGSITATGIGTGVTMSLGIVAASVGGALTCPDRSCTGGQLGVNNYNPGFASQLPGGGGAVNVTLRNGGSIKLNTGNSVGIMAVSAAGGVEVQASMVYEPGPAHLTTTTSVNDSARSGGAVTVTTEAGSRIDVGSAEARFAMGVLATSTGNAYMIRPFIPVHVETDPNISSYQQRFFTHVGSAAGGDVTVSHAGDITTQGTLAVGIAALSVGGSAVVGKGDIGAGGDVLSQGQVSVTNTGTITTVGNHSAGIVAFSGSAGGLLETDVGVLGNCDASNRCTSYTGQFIGGSDAGGKKGGTVEVTHKGVIQTGQAGGDGKYAMGIVAQSIAGGGGFHAGSAAFVGGKGVNGGDGGDARVSLLGGQVGTRGLGAIGVLAQSVGGGGGAGGNAAGLFYGLGGSGGTGGDGGAVDVSLNSMNPGVSGAYNRASSIETHGDFAQAVVAQSVGGGGGTGGHATAVGAFVSRGVGGQGGQGGSGGNVRFTSDGSSNFITTGEAGHGIVVQSIGGGGGVGGAALSGAAGALFSSSVAVGGSGGTGGKGGNVAATLNGGGQIQTQGSDSPAVIAQSVGGGGGIGGSAMSVSFAAAIPEYPALSVSVAVGGKGGSGNAAGAVTVTRGAPGIAAGSITTYGEKSEGIKAQSIGGGGGSGGDSKAISGGVPLGKSIVSVTPAIGIGGSGGTGGLGGTVTVSNQGSSSAVVGIATFADRSSGILAQSVGGGGGDGGIGSASGYNSSGSLVNIQVDVGVGGGGGSGNHGGAVKAVSAATGIQTLGAESHGIHAQSIGGGGGVAGGGGAYGFGNTVSANVSVGGSGGAGGDAGVVDVSHSGNISTGSQNQVADSAGQAMSITTGGGASGIFAQSIGGGGGQGGSADSSSAVSWAGTAGNSKEIAAKIGERVETGKGFVLPVTFNANVSVGGRGGAAGNGAAVSVVNSGTVRTAGESAFGIHAQSIGGGGGVGGAVEAHAATTANKAASFTEVAFTGVVAVGGGGGAAGNGAAVSVTHSGGLTTLGHGATGIFGQSIGGGGGYGALNTAATEGTFAIGVSKNGNGGLGGSGGTMTVTNNTGSSVLTLGEDAPGILLQSIGGGGGAGKGGCERSEHAEEKEGASLSGSKCLGSTKVTAGQGEAVWTPTSRLALAFGGGSGLSGNGGDVTQQLSGSVETRGDRSIGVVVQSIGGGGAYMTASASTLESTVVSPNAGQNSARGGTITITQGTTGRITTLGNGAWGLLAQSIGSGGGLAGDTSLDLVTTPVSNTLANLCCKSPQTLGADGGSITITNAGSITTSGRNAHGIVAQSLGGGGGISGGADQSAAATLKMGNSGQMYSAADRSALKQAVHASEASDAPRNTDVSGHAEPKTSEALTFAAPTQSGQGGTVKITNAGSVQTTGVGSIGILAQSSGNREYMSQIQVAITGSGSVIGGAGPRAAGILVSGGDAANNRHGSTPNTITVDAGASVTTVDGVRGRAILADSGLTNVINRGTITGSIDLGSTPGTVTNFGTIHAGKVLTTSSGTFTNEGTLVLGGAGISVMVGGLRQTDAGRMQLEIDPAAAPGQPLLSVQGNASIAGAVQIKPLGNLLPGNYPVIGASNLEFTGELASMLLYKWKSSTAGQALAVSADATFAPQGAGLNSSHASLAGYLAERWSQGDAALSRLFGHMSHVASVADYKQMLETLGGRALHQHSAVALQSLPVLLDQSIDCPRLASAGVVLELHRCAWGKWSRTSGDQGVTSNTGTHVTSNLVSLGGQFEVQPGWWLGGSFGAVSGRASATKFSSSGETWFGTVGLRRAMGDWTFAQSLALGRGTSDNQRQFSLPTLEGQTADTPASFGSRSNLLLAALKSRVAWQHALSDGVYIAPYADLDLLRTHHAAFDEQAQGRALSLKVRSGSNTYAGLSPMFELGGQRDLGEFGALRVYARAGWRWTPDSSPRLRMSLANATSESGMFEIHDALPSVTRIFNLGVTLHRSERFDLLLELAREVNQRSDANRGTVQFRRYF